MISVYLGKYCTSFNISVYLSKYCTSSVIELVLFYFKMKVLQKTKTSRGKILLWELLSMYPQKF